MIPILHVRGIFDKFFHSIPVIYLKTTEDDFKKWNLDVNHPVGSWWWSDDPTDPALLFGGTWERKERVTLIGATDGGKYPVGATGGTEENTISKEQMPEHTHPFNVYADGQFQGEGALFRDGSEYYKSTYLGIGNGVRSGSEWIAELGSVGKGEPVNNMQPYYATYLWRRVA